jgi:hypothetical protein
MQLSEGGDSDVYLSLEHFLYAHLEVMKIFEDEEMKFPLEEC